jgi:lipoprotein
MKKIVVILSIFIMIFVTGCGNNVSELNVDNTKSIIESNLKNMQEVDEESLKDVYGLNLDLMEVHIIKQNTDGDLYAIIKTKEKTKVKNDMKKYFEKIEKFNANYSPERLEILDNRVEKEIGDYLIYIVAKDANGIYNNIVKSL